MQAREIDHTPTQAAALVMLIRIHQWKRPRMRLYPKKATIGIRASRPNEIWHVDTTIIRLLNGTKAYLHAVIDNYSRKIQSWTIADHMVFLPLSPPC